jgi:fructose transport system ATP-binding protein
MDLEIRSGELTAIVGDNGAGKTTLVKMLTGAVIPDSGEIWLNGQLVSFHDPLDAKEQGIEAVYQELALAPNLDVVSNLFLGREITRRIWGIPGVRRLDEKAMQRVAADGIKRLEVGLPNIVGVPIGSMSGGQRQAVAVARAVQWTSQVLFMDEPTAALGHRESAAVLKIIRKVLDQGIAIVMVSHILPHVLEMADNIIVMRRGRKVAEVKESVTPEHLIAMIVGA